MNKFRTLMLALAAVSVSACAGPQTASRNAIGPATNDAPALSQAKQRALAASMSKVFIPNVKIERITVDVPRSLEVSEKNSYYPRGDIIWRGDLFGDRHEQVKAIVQKSAENAAARLQGDNPVHMHIQLTRFHGLTEKARYSTGGVHNVNFYVTLLDPVTGATLRPAEHVVTNLDALRGTEAIQADTRGDTQKHRITSFLTQVFQKELSTPEGYDDDNRGFFVALNRS